MSRIQDILIASILTGIAIGLTGCTAMEPPPPKQIVRVPRTPAQQPAAAGNGFLRPISAPAHAASPDHDEECPCTIYADFEAWLEREEEVRRYRAARNLSENSP